MSSSVIELSIIVPLAPHDQSWMVLLDDLTALCTQDVPEVAEILFVGVEPTATAIENDLGSLPATVASRFRVLRAGHSRATALNAGAAAATGTHLWFVHADSRLESRHLQSLCRSISKHPKALYYFDLRFYGHPMMWLNSLGVWIRSHWLSNPFGDQALCLAKQDFGRIGPYPEQVAMGEDHMLVWRALQDGMSLECTGTALSTSARKYQQQGWLKTTLNHVRLWAKQAWPEFKTLLRQRWYRA